MDAFLLRESYLQSGECLRKIGDQIVYVFQPDIQTQQLSLMRPVIAHPCHAIRHAKAVDATPAKTDLEQLQAIDKSIGLRSEEHTSELQSLMRISYAVFCLKKKQNTTLTK